MATYEQTVLALVPVFFGRLDELTGTVLVDKSGNAHHGTYFPEAIKGRPSPIQTDPASSAVDNRVGTCPAPASVNNFTWAGWSFYNPNSINTSGIVCRNGQVGVTTSNFLVMSHGNNGIAVRLNPDGTNPSMFDVSYSLLGRPAGFYRVCVTRNGTVVTLLLNGVVVAQRTDFISGPFTDLTYINGASVGWKLGCTGNTGNLDPGISTDEIEIYDYPLSPAQDLSVYNSAKNILPMNAVSNVIPSAVWYSQPITTPVHFSSFRHNFDEALLERISFLTNNSKTLGGSIESSEMRPTPRREIEINYLVRSDEERRAIRAKLWAHQNKTWFVPVRQDFEQLVSPLSSGVQTIPTITQYKDYEIDSWVGLRELDDQGRIIKYEVLKIDALNPNDVHVTTPTVNSYSNLWSFVYPVRRGILSRSFPVRGHNDAVETMVAVFELLPQDEAVVPNRITPWTPTILYKGYETHDPAAWQNHNWVDGRNYDVERALSRIDFEVGIFEIESDVPGAEEAFEYRMLLKGRDKIAQFLGWFYARGGSLSYLWVPSMQNDFSILSSTSNDITVSDMNYSENFALAEARRDFAFIYNDFSMALRRVLGFSGSLNETISLGLSGVPSLSNLKFLSLLKFCQMESDSIELAWVTDDSVQVAWRFKELLSTPV